VQEQGLVGALDETSLRRDGEHVAGRLRELLDRHVDATVGVREPLDGVVEEVLQREARGAQLQAGLDRTDRHEVGVAHRV
jgi:hypothetical protein